MGFLKCSVFLVVLVALVGLGLNFMGDGKVRMYYPKPTFSTEDIPDLEGSTALVTGANSGIGLANAAELARKKCVVYVGARTPEKAKKAIKKIEKEFPETKGYLKALSVGLELSSLDSVRKYSNNLLRELGSKKLNMLVNNAGIMMTPFDLTEDTKLEMQFGTNHIGHFLLTHLLLPKIIESQPSYIVCVTSLGHNFAPAEGIPFDRLSNPETYNRMEAYGISKLANILHANYLAHKLKDEKVYVNSAHPGMVATNLGRHVRETLAGFFGVEAADRVQEWTNENLALSATQGALTQLFLTTSPKVIEKDIRGEYFVPIARNATEHPFPLSGGISKQAQDFELAKKLYEWSLKTVGEKDF